MANIWLWILQVAWPVAEWALIQLLKFLEARYPGVKQAVDVVLQILSSAQGSQATGDALVSHIKEFDTMKIK